MRYKYEERADQNTWSFYRTLTSLPLEAPFSYALRQVSRNRPFGYSSRSDTVFPQRYLLTSAVTSDQEAALIWSRKCMGSAVWKHRLWLNFRSLLVSSIFTSAPTRAHSIPRKTAQYARACESKLCADINHGCRPLFWRWVLLMMSRTLWVSQQILFVLFLTSLPTYPDCLYLPLAYIRRIGMYTSVWATLTSETEVIFQHSSWPLPSVLTVTYSSVRCIAEVRSLHTHIPAHSDDSPYSRTVPNFFDHVRSAGPLFYLTRNMINVCSGEADENIVATSNPSLWDGTLGLLRLLLTWIYCIILVWGMIYFMYVYQCDTLQPHHSSTNPFV